MTNLIMKTGLIPSYNNKKNSISKVIMENFVKKSLPLFSLRTVFSECSLSTASSILKISTLLIMLISLSSCGDIINMKYWKQMSWGAQIKAVEGPGYHPVIETDPLNAVVYVYRPFSDWADQELQAPSIFIQEQRMFGLKNNMYVALELEPGRHVFSARRPLAILHVEKIFELELDVDPGEVYYMRYSEVDIPPELSFEEGYVSDGPFYQVSGEYARHELRLTQSADAVVEEVARAERCEKNRDLMYGEGQETGVEENDEGEGWSTNWRSYVEMGEDC